MIENSRIKTLAKEAGFDLCGITPIKHFSRNRMSYDKWIAQGFASSLEYMKRNVEIRFDTSKLVDDAKSVVVCAVSYKSPVSGGYTDCDKGKIASYACCRDYHKTIKKMLLSILRELQNQHPTLQGRAFVDSAPILEKQYAVEAGLGWIGHQSLLITPRYGSHVLLGELVLCDHIDMYDSPYNGNGCGECRRCIGSCPTNAITEEMTIDTTRCISCRTIEAEQAGSINLNGWIFGCDECQNCCPYNKKAESHNNKHFNPLFDPRQISTNEWLAMSEDEFSERFSSTPLKRCGLDRIKSNIAKNRSR